MKRTEPTLSGSSAARCSPERMALRRRFADARKKRAKRRGVALIMVLGTIVILTVFVTQLQESTSATLSAAIAERDAEKAEYHAKTAVNLARLLISSEPTVRTALQPVLAALTGGRAPIKQIPVWKFSDAVLGIFNDKEHAQAFAEAAGVDVSEQGGAKSIGIAGGYWELKIVDEDSKINVNAAAGGDPFARLRLGSQFLGLTAAPQYTPLFEHADPDGQLSDRPTICGALVDWSDYDETLYGCDPFGDAAQNDSAEDNIYPSIGVPYVRKNAPFDSVEELRLVRGISDTFWTTFVEADSDDPDSRVLTVWGQSQINVNTANAQTLLAIVCAGAPEATLCNDPIQMETFIGSVTLAKSLLGGIPLFPTPRAFIRAMQGRGGTAVVSIFKALGLEPVTFRAAREVQKGITTESKVFSIYADGVVPGRNRETRVRVHQVVDFRNAAELGATGGIGSGGIGSGSTTPTTTGGGTTTPTPSPTTGKTGKATGDDLDSGAPTDADVMAALLSDPAGTVIYYRIE